MADYLLLFSGGSMAISDTEREKMMNEWNAWYGRLGGAVVSRGNPINAQSRSLSSDGNVIPITGGPTPSGYAIIRAKSMDDAAELTKSCPVLKHGAEVMVYETFDAMG
jgi:hypothetical protein